MHETGTGGPGAGEMGRRGFLGWLGFALTGLVGIAGGVVAIVYAAAPALRGAKNGTAADAAWSPLPDAKISAVGEPGRHTVRVTTDAGWAETQSTYAVFVDRTTDGATRAFSARCPHEGCQVDWRSSENKYVCPCHNSSWTREGERLGGPTKRGLDPLEVREAAGGELEVRYATFALDSAERIQVG